jgi:hypothetical protein
MENVSNTASSQPTLLTEEQAHERVAHIWTLSQFKGLRNRKQGPKYARLAGKILYSAADVDTWLSEVIEKNKVDPARKPRKAKATDKAAKPAAKSGGKAKVKADELA